MKTIKYDDFLRSFEIKPSDSMSFFFGAGSSMQAGIPGTSQLVWHFKRKIYCSIRKEREDKYKDLESSYNQNIIQSYFNSLGGYPKLYDPIEYSFYFEKCYQNENDRKYFIQSVVNGVNPSIGHKCLGELIISKRINRVWTTNFDELIENGIKLVNNTISIEIFSPETTHLNNDLASQYPKILKLHGDFRYDKLQNTIQETKKLNERLSNDFKKYFLEHGLIVIGYSGNDESVIDVFDSLLEKMTFQMQR